MSCRGRRSLNLGSWYGHTNQISAAGFCMGGALGLLGSITGAPLDAVVAFYGRPEGGDVRRCPAVMLLLCLLACSKAVSGAQPSKIKIPVQGHTGTEDAFKGFADPAVSCAGAAAHHCRLAAVLCWA